MTDWRSLPEFAGIDMEDTRVVRWAYEPAAARVSLTLEASVLPSHGAYAPPTTDAGRAALGPGATVRRTAHLFFERVTEVSGLPFPPPRAWLDQVLAAERGEAPAPVDTLGTLRRAADGAFLLDATFGPVRVACARAHLVVEAPGAAPDAGSDARRSAA